MKVLIVGSGGREHALAWKFSQSKRLDGLWVIPGNGGTKSLAQNLPDLQPNDTAGMVRAARELGIELVFIGPEVPLAAGLVDALNQAGVAAIGPHKEAAQLESSKIFTKEFLLKHGIPTAQAHTFSDRKSFDDFVRTLEGLWVVKKSGLAAGKGVLESDKQEEILAFGHHALKDDSVVVEEFLEGYEVSIFTLSDGKTYKLLPAATDYKKAGVANTGPNTGGMGAISPVPWLSKALLAQIDNDLVKPVFKALEAEGLMYKGILYFGLMITTKGPKILEFNVRFGDPEAQVLIPRIQNDFCTLFEAVAQGRLSEHEIIVSDQAALGVVLAAEGYPNAYKKDLPVTTSFSNHEADRLLFHSGTKLGAEGLRTSGGRVFTCVGLGADPLEAREKAYSIIDEVRFDGAWYRQDIGANIYNH